MHFFPHAPALNRLIHDGRAGLNAAVVGLPQEINNGLLAVAPLGLAFAGQGIAATLYGAMLAVFAALLFGGGKGRIIGPRATLSFLVAGLFAALLQQPGVTAGTLPVFAVITVFLAGLILLLTARLGLGRLIKYVPVAVLSGFTTGIAGMLLLYALPVVLGAGLSAGKMAEWLPHIHPGALAITAVAVWIALCPLSWPLVRHVPGILQSLIAAWLMHRLLLAVGINGGPVLADLATALPGPGVLVSALVLPEIHLVHLATALKFAAAIAMASALETLATAAALDAQLNERTSSDAELRRLAYTMFCVAPLGMPVAGTLGRSAALLSVGAQTRMANAAYALCLLALTLLAYRWIAELPQAAIGGVLIVVARGMVGNSLQQAISAIKDAQDKRERKRSIADFSVMALVALVTLLDSFVTGLMAGIVSAMALFIRDQSRSIIRRVQFGNRCHSLRLRSPQARAVQVEHGAEIAVIEVEGVLFFGSAEHLVKQIESLPATARIVIIDLRRVSDIDTTASRMLEQTARRVGEEGRRLLLSHLPPSRRLRGTLLARGVNAVIPAENWFVDLDSALEYAEEDLLARHGVADDAAGPLPLAQSYLATGLSARQLQALAGYLVPRSLAAGEMLFRQGDTGCSLFVVTRGALSIHLPQTGCNGKRLIAFGPGAVVGEMALVTSTSRSADALADEDTELLELDDVNLQALEHAHPEIASALLRAIASILADRLRDTTGQLRVLAEE